MIFFGKNTDLSHLLDSAYFYELWFNILICMDRSQNQNFILAPALAKKLGSLRRWLRNIASKHVWNSECAGPEVQGMGGGGGGACTQGGHEQGILTELSKLYKQIF